MYINFRSYIYSHDNNVRNEVQNSQEQGLDHFTANRIEIWVATNKIIVYISYIKTMPRLQHIYYLSLKMTSHMHK